MDEALRALLVASSVNVDVAGRIYWDTIPQGAVKPCIVMFLVSGEPDYHMAGPSGLVDSRVQIDTRAATRTAALNLSRKVEAALSGYRGIIGAIKLNGIFKISERSAFEDNGAESFFLRSADYRVWNGVTA